MEEGVWWFRRDLVFANGGAQPKKDVPTQPFRHLSPRGWPQRLLEDTTNLERFLFIFQVTLLKPYTHLDHQFLRQVISGYNLESGL
jgi:hypothetical protein